MKFGHLVGSALVALQFALLALLAGLAAPSFLQGAAPGHAWGMLVGAVALGLWALSANRPGNFNIRPVPRPGGRLVRSGPYRWIRHPMYASLLLAGLAALVGVPTSQRAATGAAWLALGAVLWVKAGLEERWMAAQHPGYADYVRATRRFVPWVI